MKLGTLEARLPHLMRKLDASPEAVHEEYALGSMHQVDCVCQVDKASSSTVNRSEVAPGLASFLDHAPGRGPYRNMEATISTYSTDSTKTLLPGRHDQGNLLDDICHRLACKPAQCCQLIMLVRERR